MQSTRILFLVSLTVLCQCGKDAPNQDTRLADFYCEDLVGIVEREQRLRVVPGRLESCRGPAVSSVSAILSWAVLVRYR